jgi:polar amino acid transport system ATP-binding protein
MNMMHHSMKMDDSQPVLNIIGLSKSFGSLQVLDNVSFSVAAGETVCLLGPSGSGKSTLLRCVNWLERPDQGRILLNGEQVGISNAGVVMSDRDLARMRMRIGMVFQHFALWPHLTVLQNVMEAPVHVQRRAKDVVREEAEALLRRVGMYEKRDAFPARL